jgi:hypothetical protein
MIAIVVVAVLAFVVVAALWSRIAAARVERRSVEGYGRALDTLGGVAKRSEAVAPVQSPVGDELARPHVRPAAGAPHARASGPPIVPAPRVRIRPQGPPGRMPVFSDLAPDDGHEATPAGRGTTPPAGRFATANGSRGAPLVDEPTIVLPLGPRPVPSRADRSGGAPGAAPGNGDRPAAPPVGSPGAPDLPEGPDWLEGGEPAIEEPLTMVLPVVPAEEPTAWPGQVDDPAVPCPVYGPPLPEVAALADAGAALEDVDGALADAGVVLRDEVAPEATLFASRGKAPGEGAEAVPAVVFDAERGAVESGDAAVGDDEVRRGSGRADERTLRIRRAATGAAAAVALGALGAGGWQLASDSGHPSSTRTSQVGRSSRPGRSGNGATGGTRGGSGQKATGTSPSGSSGTSPSARPGTGRSGGATGTGTGTGGGVLQPTSTSASDVVYVAPAGTYTLTFSVTGAGDCWLGAQAHPGGPYLWMQTVAPGGTFSSTETGPVVIRLGAPPVVSVAVNGQKVALPPGNVQPYDLIFTPKGTSRGGAAT